MDIHMGIKTIMFVLKVETMMICCNFVGGWYSKNVKEDSK